MQGDPQGRPIFIAEIEQFGGAERALLALSSWLSEHGLANYLLTYKDHCNIAQYATPMLQVVDLGVAPGARKRITALRRHLAARDAAAPALLCSGYQPALHATLAGVRGFHDLMHDTPSLFGDESTRDIKGQLRIAVSSAIAGFGLRSGGATIVTSEYLRAECRKEFGVDAKIVRMGGLVSQAGNQAAARPVDAARPFHMLSVCRIEANKRIDWLLRALAQLEHQIVAPLRALLSSLLDWHLDLAGKGSLIPELEALSTSLGIEDRVHFHGFVSDAELEILYAKSSLFLMPAVQGYGIPAVEAIERGLPVLLHRSSGVSDLLLNTAWATVVTGEEAELAPALAKAIGGVLNGDHLAAPPPCLPTEEAWAREVASLCNWT